MRVYNRTGLRWLTGLIAFLAFQLPLLLADELSLMAVWLLCFFSWLILILIVAVAGMFRRRSQGND